MDNKPLISEKEFMKGIRIILKERMPEIFYSNQYLDKPLLLNFACQLTSSIKIFLTDNDLTQKKELLKMLGDSSPLGSRKIFIKEKTKYPKDITPLLSDLAKNKTLFKTKVPVPVSFMLINEEHYILKHQRKEGYLVALNADNDKNLKETLKTAIDVMKLIEENSTPYSEKQMVTRHKKPLSLDQNQRTKE